MIKAFKNIMMQMPAEQQTQQQKVYDLGIKVYTLDGLDLFLSTKHTEFGNKTGYEMLLAGKYDDVMGALAADYEGIGP